MLPSSETEKLQFDSCNFAKIMIFMEMFDLHNSYSKRFINAMKSEEKTIISSKKCDFHDFYQKNDDFSSKF